MYEIRPVRKHSLREKINDLTGDLSLLAAVTIFLTFSFGALAYCVSGARAQGIFTDLAITSFGIFVTVFLVDAVVERNQRMKWEGLREVAFDRLRVTTAKMLYEFSSEDPDSERMLNYRVSMESIRMYSYRYWEHFLNRDGWREYILNIVVPNMQEFYPGPGQDVAKALRGPMLEIQKEYEYLLAMFMPVLEPAQIEHISEITMWLDLLQNRVLWEAADIDLRWYGSNAMKVGVKLIDSMGPIPEPISVVNDPRYADFHKELSERTSNQ